MDCDPAARRAGRGRGDGEGQELNGDEEHKGTRAPGVQTAEGCLTDRGVASEGIRNRGNDVRWGSVFQSLFRTCWNWIPSQRCSMTMTGREQACLHDVSLSLFFVVELRVLLWQRDVGDGMFSGQTGRGAANRHKKRCLLKERAKTNPWTEKAPSLPPSVRRSPSFPPLSGSRDTTRLVAGLEYGGRTGTKTREME